MFSKYITNESTKLAVKSIETADKNINEYKNKQNRKYSFHHKVLQMRLSGTFTKQSISYRWSRNQGFKERLLLPQKLQKQLSNVEVLPVIQLF